MGAVGDIVLVEDTGRSWDGVAGRVSKINDDMTVSVAFGSGDGATFNAEDLGVVNVEDTDLIVEKYCSVCGIMSYDNKSGGYNHKHHVEATGIDVACDYDGLLYVEGYRIPDLEG